MNVVIRDRGRLARNAPQGASADCGQNARDPQNAQSTLIIRSGDTRWDRVAKLYGQAKRRRLGRHLQTQ
jgi:nucleoid-associated protein YgaU